MSKGSVAEGEAEVLFPPATLFKVIKAVQMAIALEVH